MKLKENFLNVSAKLRLLKPFLHLTPIYTETSSPEYFCFKEITRQAFFYFILLVFMN